MAIKSGRIRIGHLLENLRVSSVTPLNVYRTGRRTV
jgi:hypothetical protein